MQGRASRSRSYHCYNGSISFMHHCQHCNHCQDLCIYVNKTDTYVYYVYMHVYTCFHIHTTRLRTLAVATVCDTPGTAYIFVGRTNICTAPSTTGYTVSCILAQLLRNITVGCGAIAVNISDAVLCFFQQGDNNKCKGRKR